jgi:hypothetical protein
MLTTRSHHQRHQPMKVQKKESMLIWFSDEDYEGISFPHTDALVITLTVVNHNTHA